MACLPKCARCNYTQGPTPPWCCTNHCEQVDLHVLGYCQELPPTPLDPCEVKNSLTFTIIITVIAIISAIGLFGAILFVWRRKTSSQTIINLEGLSSSEIKTFLHGIPNQYQKQFSETSPLTGEGHNEHEMTAGHQMGLNMAEEKAYDSKYEVPEKGFTLDEQGILGSGAYGVVYKGQLWGQMVAVKTVKPYAGKDYLKALLSEIKVLIYLGQHENIVGLQGAFTSHLKTGVVYVFLEYCALGDLLSYLRKNKTKMSEQKLDSQDSYENFGNDKSRGLTSDNLLMWSIQISNALRFLADKKVIHGDISARNVLLYNKDVAKLTDFGLSRRLYEYTNYVKQRQEPLPWRWMSIEALRQMQFSTQSDVWSFACLIWEIYTLGDVPYTGLTWSQEFVYELMDGLRLKKPKECDDQVYELMTQCWNNDPLQRPTFVEIHKRLVSFRDCEYIKI